MSETLILQFDGVGQSEYNAVNAKLGIDPVTGQGDWPAGLLAHAGGHSDDGRFVVAEVWESRDAQAEFMHGRLGEALAAGGITTPPAVTWVTNLAFHLPG